jgi:hypothetical protein
MVIGTYRERVMALPKKKAGFVGNDLVISIPEAGRRLGISRDAAYRAAKSGDIPTIDGGHAKRVPVVRLNRLLEGE